MKKLKTLILGVGLYSILFFFSSAVYKSAGSHPGSTGAPKELTCARSTCHDDYNASPGEGVNTFKFGNNITRYKKGSTYDVSVRVSKIGLVRSGFEIVALDSLDKMIGTWKIFNATRTQITKVDSLSRFYVTHKVASTPSAPGENYNEWGFGWTAPANYEGKVTFYYATNVCNSDGKRFGDKTYLSSHTIYGESMIVASTKQEDLIKLSAYPNPSNGKFNISLNDAWNENSRIEVFNTNGVLIANIGVATQEMAIDLSNQESGIYLIKYTDGLSYSVKKVIIR